ncbi:MAG: hypothetical protein SVT56_06095, partial [Chloroflexota bacterium]|nr:hypothetical protein [Chloroflexota bacterium]
MISLDLPGIIVKPYVRMTRRGKHVDPEAQEYLASKENLSWKVKETLQNQGLTMFPGQVPLQVTIRLFAP